MTAPPRTSARQVPWARLFVLMVGARLALTVLITIGINAGLVQPNGAQYRGTGPYSMWFLWDSYWYEKLAVTDWLTPLTADGQAFVDRAASDPSFNEGAPDELHRFAFAPLFPLLAKPIAGLTGSADLALMAVSQAAAYGCVVMGHLLGRFHFGDRFGFATAVAVAAMPMSFLLWAPMTEPLFTFALMLTIWATLTKRWALAAVAAFALGLTRSTGFMVAIPIGVIVWHMEGWRLIGRTVWRTYLRALPAIVAGPLAWALFCLWCKVMTGDWLAYNHIQQAGWGVHTAAPWYPVVDVLTDASGRSSTRLLLLMVVLVLVSSIIAAVWLRQPGLAVLAVVLLLLPMMMGDRWLWSILRYLAPVFPVALAGAAVYRRSRALGWALLIASVLTQIVICFLWQSPARYIVV